MFSRVYLFSLIVFLDVESGQVIPVVLELLDQLEYILVHNSGFRVCSLHFMDQMYATETKRRLHEDAVRILKFKMAERFDGSLFRHFLLLSTK